MRGNLLIAGGAVKANQKDIYEKFISLAGGVDSKFAIVPSASSEPEKAAKRFKSILEELGVPRANLSTIKIAPQEEGIDHTWALDGDDLRECEKLNDVTGIWFTGGNQHRIIKTLTHQDGTDTTVLRRIREILDANGIVGGSSAGAAIMSRIMLGGGTSFGALSFDHFDNLEDYEKNTLQERTKALLVMEGLGFFNLGIIDQHFDTRARFGRLIETAIIEGRKEKLGFGICENTGLVFDCYNKDISVVGSGGIYIVDVRKSKRIKVGTQSVIEDVILHYIEGEDRYNIQSEGFCFNGKEELTNKEMNDYSDCIATGVLSPYSTLVDFVAHYLIDNKGSGLYYSQEKQCGYAKSYLIDEKDGEMMGYEIRAYKKENFTRGYYSHGYSFKNVLLDILPIEININLKK